jgi:hypothetical protein
VANTAVPQITTQGKPFEVKWGVPFNFDDDLQSDPTGNGLWGPYDLTGLTIVFQLFTHAFVLEVEDDAILRNGDPTQGQVRFAASGVQLELAKQANGSIARRLAQWVLKDVHGHIVDVVPRGSTYREVIIGPMPAPPA